MDKEHAVFIEPNFVIQIWRRTLAEDVRKNTKLFAEHMKKTQEKIAHLVIIEPDGEPPDKEARALLDDLAALLMPRAAVIAYAYQGSGLKAITIRAIMTGLSLVGRHEVPIKIASTTNEALAFIAKHMPSGTAIERSKIVATAMREFREQSA